MNTFNSLVLTQDFPPIPGGVSVFVENLYRNWTGRTLILAPKLKELSNTKFPPNVFVKHIPMDLQRNGLQSYLSRQLSLYKASRKIIKQERIDIIQCTHIASGLAALLLNKVEGIPYVLYTYGSDITGQPGLLRHHLTKSILENAFYLVTMSQFTLNAILNHGISEKKIRILAGVDLSQFIKTGNIEKTRKKYNITGNPVILTVARLVEHKGIDTVIKAIPRMLKMYPNLLYLVIGEGSYRNELEVLINGLKLKEHVRLLGHIPHNEMQNDTEAFYSLCDLFLLVSRNIEGIEAEGFGLVFLEAALSRKAVVGGDSGGIADAVLDGVTGKLVDPTDPGAVAECVISLLNDSGTAMEMGENGYRRAVEFFNWKTNVRKWEQDLVYLLSNK